MMTPIKKLMATMTHTFLDLVISLPTASPSGIMDISEPKVNNPMPTISSRLPSKNAIMALLEIGVMVKHSTSTMAVMGSTEVSDSFRGLRKMVSTSPASRRCAAGDPAAPVRSMAYETNIFLLFQFSPDKTRAHLSAHRADTPRLFVDTILP